MYIILFHCSTHKNVFLFSEIFKNLPNCLIVGVGKCGTTALWDIMKMHSKVRGKELPRHSTCSRCIKKSEIWFQILLIFRKEMYTCGLLFFVDSQGKRKKEKERESNG